MNTSVEVLVLCLKMLLLSYRRSGPPCPLLNVSFGIPFLKGRMSINHIIDNGTCPPEWVKIRGHRLHSCTDIQFDRDLIGTLRLNGNIPPGGPRTFLHTDTLGVINWKTFDRADIPAGANGDYLQTIGGLVEWAPPSFSPSVISPGLANQIFHTDQTGTVAEWASDIEVPGDLKINGDTDIVSDLQFNGSSGTSGQYLVKTGAATQSWQNLSVSTNSITAGADYTVLTSAGGSALWITPPVVNQIKYGTTFLAQNINAAAGPTALQFSTSTFINSAISNVGVPVNITQPSATEFTIGTSSVYNIDITGYTVPGFTPDGLGGSVVTLSLEVAGTEKTDYCIVCSGDYSFSGRFPAVLITAGQNIRVLARRVVGTAALTTFANGLPAPSFASSILIST